MTSAGVVTSPHTDFKTLTSTSLQSSSHPFIHIVGLYKCGTSWLLRMLCAHPQVIGWREYDPIRTALIPDRRLQRWPGLALAYARRRQNERWLQSIETFQTRSPEEVFRDTFLGRGWIPVMGHQLQEKAGKLDLTDLEALLDALLTMTDGRLRPDTAPELGGTDLTQPLGYQSIRRRDLLGLMAKVRDQIEVRETPGQFYQSLAAQVDGDTRIATKAADQIMQFRELKQISPHSRCIAIVRDARDAAISARHFESLMRSRQAPWQVRGGSALRKILAWAVRANKVIAHAQRGELVVLRYEDLKTNFAETLEALLETLELEASPSILRSIREATDFTRMSGGRAPGSDAAHEVRRGMVGEWRDAMPSTVASVAWQLAGRELSSFGYEHDGTIRPSPLVLGSTSKT